MEIDHHHAADPYSLINLLFKFKIHNGNGWSPFYIKFNTRKTPITEEDIREYGGAGWCKICGQPEHSYYRR